MKGLFKITIITLIFGATSLFALSAGEVKSFVLKAKAYCDKEGITKCVKEINTKNGMFDKGELYIWANDFNGVITAHPKKPIAGKNLYRYRDKSGNQAFKNFIDKVKADGSGWVNYIWSHPTTGKQAQKSSFVIGIGENQLIGAGYYK